MAQYGAGKTPWGAVPAQQQQQLNRPPTQLNPQLFASQLGGLQQAQQAFAGLTPQAAAMQASFNAVNLSKFKANNSPAFFSEFTRPGATSSTTARRQPSCVQSVADVARRQCDVSGLDAALGMVYVSVFCR
jgi:hypothetical protein